MLLGNGLQDISLELTLAYELLFDKKEEFPFFNGLSTVTTSISSVLNFSQKVLSAISLLSKNSLPKLKILFSSARFESLHRISYIA